MMRTVRECQMRLSFVFATVLAAGLVASAAAHACERPVASCLPAVVDFPDPGRVPGAVDPGIALMPLPHVGPSRTQAVYPRGY